MSNSSGSKRSTACCWRADASDTRVSDLAADHGFFQFGRFAADCKRTFGELPSETLQI